MNGDTTVATEREPYSIGYGPAGTAMMAGRTAQGHAAFFLPYLKPGRTLLDGGCGPGSITLGLAAAVAPGRVVGIDVESGHLDLARERAAKQGLTNVSFEPASLYELPFAADSFDAVFLSAVLGNLRDPLRGLGEVRRVLRAGGVIGVTEFDKSGDLTYPLSEAMRQTLDLYARYKRSLGHEPDSGRRIPALLQTARFRAIQATASYHTVRGSADLARLGQEFAALLAEAWGDAFQREGWTDAAGVERMIADWRAFSEQPGAFLASAWCEVVAWK
jgi:ubiquinone/menaquinone biosynthesis C-methylase UbiE